MGVDYTLDIKKIVIAFSLLLMLTGVTVSVLKWLKVGPFAEIVEEVSEKEATVPVGPPIAIDMDNLSIPIFAEDRVAATVVIKLKVEVIGSENKEKVTKLLPRLSDAFFKDLYTFIPRVIHQQNKLNASILVERLKMTGDKVMGQNIIHDVIIEEVTER